MPAHLWRAQVAEDRSAVAIALGMLQVAECRQHGTLHAKVANAFILTGGASVQRFALSCTRWLRRGVDRARFGKKSCQRVAGETER
eukprot:12043680-Alexandrium_andersonii.AAC.1